MKLQTPFTPMARLLIAPALFFISFISVSGTVSAAELQGRVVDPTGSPISGAVVAAFNNVGVIVQQITDDQGHFDFNVSPVYETYQLRLTAAGFQMVTVGAGAAQIQLQIAPQTESIRVEGSAIDVPTSQQGTSVSTITSAELRERNEALVGDV